ncbi:MAG TPA: S41 family peptidase, partial [Blastocatellia bacterium]|nr:S41 family peptidase [Blastocatellia bacterium]
QPARFQAGASPAPSGDARIETRFIATETAGTLFENVARVLQKKYYDQRFRTDVLPKLLAQYSEKARRASSLREQREVTEEFLSHIPASHLGLVSKTTHRYVMYDLEGRIYPTFGFQLIEINSRYYAFTVLEGGPGSKAGLLPWDRVVTIDGVAVDQSPRVDWRSDDAFIGDDRDPPVHYLTTSPGDTIRLKVERRPGKFLEVTVPSEDYSAFEAAKASARVIKAGGRSFGYVHFWYVHLAGVPEMLKETFEGKFGACDGLIVDLRGRGGNGMAIAKIVDVLRADREARNRPIVALVDRQSRSAKDVLAYEFKNKGVARLVGEPTAGAVIPASFADVGHDTILMFPSFKLPRYTDLLELKPVDPDVLVQRAGPLSAGDDPIFTAGLAEVLRLAKATTR